MRMYRYAENNLKQYVAGKMDVHDYLCHTWISEDKVVVGTNTGKWILFEGGEMRAEGNVKNLIGDIPSDSK